MASLLGSCSTTHTRSGSAQGSAEPRQRGALERTLTAIPRTIVAVPEGILSIPGQFMAMRERANAFISYSAPPRKSTELRLAVKDLIDMKGKVTSAGSEYVAKNSAPAAQDAPCLQLARERNVRIVGKTNLTELAVTASGRNRYFGTPISRLDGFHENIAGGSSSGSAVAVKTGMADVAFGTDTAGSIRTPAACCGVYGLKTTFGLVPTKGVFPISPDHLDTVGPLAKDLPHLVQGMDLLQRGFAEQYQKAVAAKPSGAQLRIGRLYLDGTDPAINKAIDDALAAAGCRVVKLGDDFKAKWVQAQKYGKTVALGDIWRHDKEYVNKQGVRKTTKGVILLGELEEKNYAAAVAAKAGWQSALRQVFEQVDFIALPTLQKLPPHPPVFSVPAVFEWQVFNVQNTLPANYAGNPALAMPVAMPAKAFTVPVTSLQLIGPPNSEAGLLNAARLIGRPIPDPAFNSGMKAMGSAMFGWMDDEPSRTEATR